MPQIGRLSDLHPAMILRLPGCSDSNLWTMALQWASREFCRKTESWTETLTEDIVESQFDYTLASAFDADIYRVKEVWIRTEDQVDEDEDGVEQDPSLYAYDPEDEELTLDDSLEPAEDVTDGLQVVVVLIPTIGTSELAGWFLNRWAEALVAGAVHYLAKMPKKGWSDMDEAGRSLAEFNGYITQAKSDTEREYKEPVAGLEG